MIFLKRKKGGGKERETIDPFFEYRANLLIDNSNVENFPVKIEVAPDQRSLLGSIEYDFALKYPDFRYINPGAFYLAYGGFLILDGNENYVQENGMKIIKRSMAEGILPMIPSYPGFAIRPEQPNWDLTIILYAEYKSMNLLFEKEVELQNIFPTILRIS